MIGIVAHWENAVAISRDPHATKKLLGMWTHIAKAFGIRDVYLIDVDGIEPFIGDAQINFRVFPTLEAVQQEFQDILIYVDEGGIPLKDFVHPTDVLYVFGSNYGGMNVPAGAKVVSLDLDIKPYVESLVGIILYDRRVKLGT